MAKRTKKMRSEAAKASWARRNAGTAAKAAKPLTMSEAYAKAASISKLPIVDYAMPLLNERGATHGNFAANAETAQKIKDIIHGPDLITFAPRNASLSPVQREVLDLIATKMSRILSGQSNFKDHWDDIAGYATLASKDIGS